MFNKKIFNNKGFTVVEVVLSFSLVVVILASLVSIVVNYRDRVTEEEIKTQLIDFKNTITKVVYDDIVDIDNVGYTSISECSSSDKCVNFVKEDGSEVPLNIIVQETSTSGIDRGIYFEYKGIKYFLPDSDLNDYLVGDISKYAVYVNDFIISRDDVNKVYSVKIPIHHNGLNKDYVINLTVS